MTAMTRWLLHDDDLEVCPECSHYPGECLHVEVCQTCGGAGGRSVSGEPGEDCPRCGGNRWLPMEART